MGEAISSEWKYLDHNTWKNFLPETSKEIDDAIKKAWKNTQSQTMKFQITKGKWQNDYLRFCYRDGKGYYFCDHQVYFARIAFNSTGIAHSTLVNNLTATERHLKRFPPLQLPYRKTNNNQSCNIINSLIKLKTGRNVVNRTDNEKSSTFISDIKLERTDILLESTIDECTGKQLKAKVIQYKERNEALRRDELCGLLKAKDMHQQMKQICDTETKNSWLVSADMDKMKDLNSEFGKNKVDEIITQIGKIFKQFESEYCTPYRKYDSGDEFFLIFINSAEHDVLTAATYLSERVQQIQIQKNTTATISIGVAVHECADTYRAWEDRAEAQMKFAKNNSGNCVFYTGKKVDELPLNIDTYKV